MKKLLSIFALALTLVCGCTAKPQSSSTKPLGPFSLAWSEYPSWSVFGVANELGWIEGEAGKLGEYEKKWNVDIVLKQADYDPCITMYGSGVVDAVCITNMDILGPADKIASVAILPTSTSNGADACIGVGIDSLDGLKGVTTYGLERTVSQYCFERCLEQKGATIADYPFSNMDPGVAAQAVQNGDPKVRSIIVWNPFVMQTLAKKADARVIFDSTSIPEEIIDMVVVSKSSLAKPGGKNFAMAILDVYYALNKRMSDPKTADETLKAIGDKFGKLGLDEMRKIVQQTSFYATPNAALKLLEGEVFRDKTMPLVTAFCKDHGIIDKTPSIGFSNPNSQVNFELDYLKQIQAGVTPDKL